MTAAERAFALGVGLGVAGSLIPDLPDAIKMHEEEPERRPVLYACYLFFAIVTVVVIAEVFT